MKTSLLLLCFFSLFCFCRNNAQNFSQEKSIGNKEHQSLQTQREDSSKSKEHPVIPGDFPDPSIIRHGDVYYAAATSSEWAPHFPLFQSADLLHWQPIGYVFPKTPSWAASSFWAPELFYHNGLYYVYYVAKKRSGGISCIGVATSTDPAKGFTDKGIVLAFGREAIDPFVIEDSGNLYITWKAYGLDGRPIEILGSRLSGDGLKVEGEPFSLLRDDEKKGLEGQCLVKRNGYYYLLYSAGGCCGSGCSYRVEVARSASLQGPYVRFSGNPILSQTADWKCTGHGTIVTAKDGEDYYLYHAYNKTDDVYTGRQGMLGKVTWDAQTGWPHIEPQGEKAAKPKGFRDEFSNDSLSLAWQWDFRHAQPQWNIKQGVLYLSGKTTPDNVTGTALTVRPLTGNYEITTEVVNHNEAVKGLVLYGDAGQSIGIGVTNNTVQVWEVNKNKRTVLKEKEAKTNGPWYVKMKVENGYQCRFYWSEDGKVWEELKGSDAFYKADFLPVWDRSPRPGLLQQGADAEPAGFAFFEIAYM